MSIADDLLAAQVLVDQRQPQRRVLERHQPVARRQRDRQQLAPAVGDPSGIVQPQRLAQVSLTFRYRKGRNRRSSPGRFRSAA